MSDQSQKNNFNFFPTTLNCSMILGFLNLTVQALQYHKLYPLLQVKYLISGFMPAFFISSRWTPTCFKLNVSPRRPWWTSFYLSPSPDKAPSPLMSFSTLELVEYFTLEYHPSLEHGGYRLVFSRRIKPGTILVPKKKKKISKLQILMTFWRGWS